MCFDLPRGNNTFRTIQSIECVTANGKGYGFHGTRPMSVHLFIHTLLQRSSQIPNLNVWNFFPLSLSGIPFRSFHSEFRSGQISGTLVVRARLSVRL